MAKANFTIKMVACTMAIGPKTKWMAMDPCTISPDNLHTKACGRMTNSRAKANYLINLHNHSMEISIIRILMKSMNFGNTTKVHFIIFR